MGCKGIADFIRGAFGTFFELLSHNSPGDSFWSSCQSPLEPLKQGPKIEHTLGGRTATRRSKKGSEKVLGKGSESGEGLLRRVLRRGPAMGFTVQKGSEKGSQKGF